MRIEAATERSSRRMPEQQVLGADVVVEQAVGFFGRKLQHALGFRAERDLDRGRDLLAEHRPAFDFLADVLERQVRARKDPAGQPFALANQAQKEMLGLNRDAAELTGLVAGEEENSPGPFGVPFEHPAYLGESRWVVVTEAMTTLYGIAPAEPNGNLRISACHH